MPNCEHPRRLRPSRVIAPVLSAGLVALAVGCGSSTPSNETAPAATPAAAPAESHEGHGGSGRVFFVENFTISPVPEGTVEHPREGMGHHHLGVEQDCMPAGQEIPKGTPGWVHFGKGDKTIDMQLTPGKHKFALQRSEE